MSLPLSLIRALRDHLFGSEWLRSPAAPSSNLDIAPDSSDTGDNESESVPCILPRVVHAQLRRQEARNAFTIQGADTIIAKIIPSLENHAERSVSEDPSAFSSFLGGDQFPVSGRPRTERQKIIKGHQIIRGGDTESDASVTIEYDCGDITRNALDTLRPHEWLDDEIMNCWFELIQKRNDRTIKEWNDAWVRKKEYNDAAWKKLSGDKEELDLDIHTVVHPDLGMSPSPKRVYIFSTFFWHKLTSNSDGYSFKAVSRWTKRKKVDIFAYDILLIPIHIGFHWALGMIHLDHKRIYYFDSMAGGTDPVESFATKAKRWVSDEHLDKKGSELECDESKGDWSYVDAGTAEASATIKSKDHWIVDDDERKDDAVSSVESIGRKKRERRKNRMDIDNDNEYNRRLPRRPNQRSNKMVDINDDDDQLYGDHSAPKQLPPEHDAFSPPPVPQQTNGNDCGVFTCWHAEAIADGRWPDAIDFDADDMPHLRDFMAYLLFSKEPPPSCRE